MNRRSKGKLSFLNTKSLPAIIIIGSVFFLILLSLTTFYSTTISGTAWTFTLDNLVLKATIYILLAFVLFFVISRIDYTYTQGWLVQVILLGVITILLIGLFIFGGDIAGTKRWYHVGGFLLQPSELAKVIVILWSAFWLTWTDISLLKRLAGLISGVLLVTSLVFLQPDAGSAIIILGLGIGPMVIFLLQYRPFVYYLIYLLCLILTIVIVFALVWIFKFSLGAIIVTMIWTGLMTVISILIWIRSPYASHIILGGILTIIMAVIGMIGLWKFGLKDYQKARVTPFLQQVDQAFDLPFINIEVNEEEAMYEDVTEFQIEQAKIAIGSGGIFGKGLGEGTQTRLRFLPEYTTDFIFAAFVEEWGLVGGMTLIILYLLLLGSLFYLVITIGDFYAKLIILGTILKFWVEIFINVGMNMGLLPTKGVPLPFMSYGGSAMLGSLILLGVIFSIMKKGYKGEGVLSLEK